MKAKTAKQPKQAKATVQLKDINPKKDANGGALNYISPRYPKTYPV